MFAMVVQQNLLWAGTLMGSQPSMGGHLPKLYTNKPPMGSHLPWKAIFQVPQGWQLIAGSTVVEIK